MINIVILIKRIDKIIQDLLLPMFDLNSNQQKVLINFNDHGIDEIAVIRAISLIVKPLPVNQSCIEK